MKTPPACGQISASMMCSDLVDLRSTIKAFEKTGVDYLHIDVMDGEFVPNFGLGVDYVRGLRGLTQIPLDFHLMIKEPEHKLQWFNFQSSDIVSIHYESTYQVQRALDRLQKYNCKRFLAITPATPIGMLEEVLDYIDGVNLLMVNPGFAGQTMLPSALHKAEKCVTFLKDKGRPDITIEVDGNITPEHAATLRSIGADIFVAGSSSVFRGGVADYAKNVRRLRACIS